MAIDSNETLMVQQVRGALPDGFDTTLRQSSRLRELHGRLNSNDDPMDVGETVDDYASFQKTEQEVVSGEIDRVLASFLTPERTMELPGVGLEYERLILYASWYKHSNETPTGTIKDPIEARSDDIAFSFAGPEFYNSQATDDVQNFEITGISQDDRVELISDQPAFGQGNSGTSTEPLDLDDDVHVYFTGDYIDLSSGESVLTRYEWDQIDGNTDFGPSDVLMSGRLSGAHLGLGQGAWLKRDGRLSFRAYAAGDAEVVPVAFYMAPGHKVPSL